MGDLNKKCFEWVKLILENKWLILLVVSALGIGNGVQAVDRQKKDGELLMLGESYAKLIYNPKLIEPGKKEIKKDSCFSCEKLMRDHVKEYH